MKKDNKKLNQKRNIQVAAGIAAIASEVGKAGDNGDAQDGQGSNDDPSLPARKKGKQRAAPASSLELAANLPALAGPSGMGEPPVLPPAAAMPAQAVQVGLAPAQPVVSPSNVLPPYRMDHADQGQYDIFGGFDFDGFQFDPQLEGIQGLDMVSGMGGQPFPQLEHQNPGALMGPSYDEGKADELDHLGAMNLDVSVLPDDFDFGELG